MRRERYPNVDHPDLGTLLGILGHANLAWSPNSGLNPAARIQVITEFWPLD